MADTSGFIYFKSVTEEAPAAPDSTTSMFVEGEDVLVDRNHTGQYFMGTIVQIDRPTEKCLLRFLDNKECWAHLNELQRVKDDPEEILCVVCKKIDQHVVRCPKCNRGYHRKCLELSIPEGVSASKWLCLRCGSKTLKKKRGRLSLLSTQSRTGRSSSLVSATSISSPVSSETVYLSESDSNSVQYLPTPTPSTSKDTSLALVRKQPIRKFPYAQYPLVWDESHRVNDAQQYCYCGKPGDWYMQMLQCAGCRQWFHQDCLSCLHFPLYCGDQMYLFLCSVCNDEEFLRRFDFGWVDIVHLTIFNLILFKRKKYFDVDNEIIPYVKNNWFYLQIPAQLVKCSDLELKQIILKMLEDNSTRNCRFKWGRDIKSKKRIWGLRSRVPPRRIPFSLPPVRPLTEDAVRAWWKKCHISFRQPFDAKYLMRDEIVLQPGGGMAQFDYGLMIGSTPSFEINSKNLRISAVGIHLLDSSILRNKFSSAVAVNGGQALIQNDDTFTGYAKKSSAVCASNRLTLQESLRRNRKALKNRVSLRGKTFEKKELSTGEQDNETQEYSSQDGYDSLDSQASISQDENYISSNAASPDEESLDDNNTSQDGYDSSEEESDNTEESAFSLKCGTSAVPFSPADTPSVDSEDDFKVKVVSPVHMEKANHVKQEIQVASLDVIPTPSFHVDQAPDEQLKEETPSLLENLSVIQPEVSPVADVILPTVFSTPADTEVDEDSVGPLESQRSSLPTIADLIGSPIVIDKEPTTPLILPTLPRLTPVIKEPPQARAVKRKLSEKDIKIVNGQVKQRRRLRRIQSNHAIGTRTVHLDSGEKLEKRIVGGKLLRSPHKPSVPEAPPEVNVSQAEPSASSSSTNFGRPEDLSLADVKRNIKCIFNARNRISAGEKFSIKGRRVTADGVEYLIQWNYSL